MQVQVKSQATATLGLFLFALGILLGVILVGLMIWADLEAVLFAPSIGGDESLTIHCPTLLVAGQTERVSAVIRNPLERDATFSVRTNISEGHVTLLRQEDDILTLAPGDSQRLEWDVTGADAVYGLFILVKVHLFGHYPLPSREGSCGVLTLDLPFGSGTLVFVLVLIVLLLLVGGGIALWRAGRGPLKEHDLDTARAMVALSVMLVLGLLAGTRGWWLFGLVAFAINVILILAILGYQVERRRR